MIMRILGEGQYEVADEHLNRLNELDTVLQSAADAGDEAAFTTALSALLDAVRSLGTPLPDERITPSDLVLPDADTSLAQVRALLSDEGLIPG
ncbi:PspA-associated protein PspAA [Streptomyces albogriseolus]